MKRKPFPIEGVVPKEVVLTELWSLSGNVVWNKLYRRDLFDSIRYPIGKYSEDTAVTHRLVYKANNTYLLNKYLYNYRDYRPGSITNTRSYKSVIDYMYFSFRFVDDLRIWGYDFTKKEKTIALTYLAAIGRKSEFSVYCERVLRNCQNFDINTSWKQKIMFHVYKKSPRLFDYISILTGRRVNNILQKNKK